MPTKEISPSRDVPTHDVANSKRSSRYDVTLSSEAYNYCLHQTHDNTPSQQEVGEQAYEQKLAKKGKNLAIPDEASWHSDTSSSSGYSSESDSEMSASLDTNRPEKLIVVDNPYGSLLGAGDPWSTISGATASSIHGGAAHAASDLTGLVKLGWGMFNRHQQRKKAEKFHRELQAQRAEAEIRQKESEEQISNLYDDRINELRKQRRMTQTLTFDEHRRRNPNVTRDAFEKYKESMLARLNEEIDFMLKLTPEQWYRMKKREEERNRDRPGPSH